MAQVGDKHFSYRPEGIKAAQAESARTGIPMVKTQQYQVGGMVKRGRGAETRGAGIERKKSKHRFV